MVDLCGPIVWIETRLFSEPANENFLEGFAIDCFVGDKRLISCNDLEFLLVVNRGVPGISGESFPETLLDTESLLLWWLFISFASSVSKPTVGGAYTTSGGA